MEKKRTVKLGRSEVDIGTVVRDIRGVEDIVAEAIEEDWKENHYIQFDERLFPFPDAGDIAEWDSYLTSQYPPLYTNPQEICHDCHMGPCNLGEKKGKCGLEFEPYQAKLNLRMVCTGCLSQMMDTRELVNYAIKVFGKEKPITWGMLQDKGDTCHIRLLTGMFEKDLGTLDRALCYAEEQLHKLVLASQIGTGGIADFEEMAFHAGSMLLVVQDVAELVKMNCFGLSNASNFDINKLDDYPWMVNGGLASLEAGKPVIAFVGDNFLPGWVAVNCLKQDGLTQEIEICGIGPAGDDIARFYDRCRVITGMVKASKTIRSGFADVIVGSSSCISFDILSDARSVDSRLIWISKESNVGLPDRTDDPVDKIVEDLVAGAPGAWIRDCEKAGEAAVKAAQEIKRKPSSEYLLSEDKAKAEAKKCRQDCDLCFNICPNGLMIGRGIRKVEKEGLGALSEVEKGCYLCGKCAEVCPENIRILDLIIAAQGKRAAEDKFVMRAGRGPAARTEVTGAAWGMISNAPGGFHILGCGDAKTVEDIGWIANELVSRNCSVAVAGCAAGEVARQFDKEKGGYLFERYGGGATARNIINAGGCSACVHLLDQAMKWARIGSSISCYANYAPTADVHHNIVAPALIVWGSLPNRMQAMIAAWARGGSPVIIGPSSAFNCKRYLLGNKWDWEKWWSYLVMAVAEGREKKLHEPLPKHMVIPVETKEEALTTAIYLVNKASMIWDSRQTNLETFMEEHKRLFGEYADDWHLLVRSDLDLPQRYKMAMIKMLREECGWEIERMTVKRQRLPGGRLVTRKEFDEEYGLVKFFPTNLPRGMAKPLYFRTGGKPPGAK